ncbi:MAG: amidohydrolase family protein [Burkholderiales bacterium]
MIRIDARWALTESGWRRDARLVVGDDGRIAAVEDAPAPPDPQAELLGEARRTAVTELADLRADLVVPGLPDAHCHAFQYAIAGLTERAGGRGDTFWTWRERMYAAVATLDADALERTATELYRRLRANGYTSVAEFHYLHRLGPDHGRRASLASALESSQALVRAAAAAGVTLLLLPVLYRWGGFRRAELGTKQARFALARDDYRRLVEALVAQAADPSLRGALRIGLAPHSLRACDPEDVAWLLSLREALAPDCPVHVHVSEQPAEVRDARAALGQTPIAWLCEHAPVDARWTLVHATHATTAELREVLSRGATVCVCTTTEANLGDGFFPVDDWFAAGGRLSVGSDSNVGTDGAEELRWLEYQARLRRQARAVLVDPDCPHPGTALWRRAVAGGRLSFGEDRPGLAPGAPGELLLIDNDAGLGPDDALDDLVFARRATRVAGSLTPAGLVLADGR